MSRKRALPASQAPRTALSTLPPDHPLLKEVQDALLTSFREVGLPLLERLSRTDPKEFRMWYAMAIAAGMGSKNATEMQGTVVNVVNAIPRSPLDVTPDNFGQ